MPNINYPSDIGGAIRAEPTRMPVVRQMANVLLEQTHEFEGLVDTLHTLCQKLRRPEEPLTTPPNPNKEPSSDRLKSSIEEVVSLNTILENTAGTNMRSLDSFRRMVHHLSESV